MGVAFQLMLSVIPGERVNLSVSTIIQIIIDLGSGLGYLLFQTAVTDFGFLRSLDGCLQHLLLVQLMPEAFSDAL